MAFNPLKLFNRQQSPAPAGAPAPVADPDAAEGANERGSATFNDVQTFRPEIEDEVVLGMLNNKYPENMKHELMDTDGKFGPETLNLDASTPKLAEAVAFSDDGPGPEVLSLDKSTPKLDMARAPETNADGILPYVEQENYHGGGEAMQDVFVTEAVAPNPQSNLLDAGPVLGDDFTGSDQELGELVSRLQQRGLIDTSTGEIVWADEATANFTGSDEELGALVAWLRGNNLIDTSTGEIVWVRQPAEGSNWFVPEMDSDQSGMAREVNQVFVGGFGGGRADATNVRVATGDVNGDGTADVSQVSVGGFGGGVDDDRLTAATQPQGYFEDSVRTAREAVAEPPTEEVGFVFHATGGDAPEAETSALHGYGTVSGVSGDWDGDARDTIGASTLLPTDPNAAPYGDSEASLNFEEIKVTFAGTEDIDLDPGDADIETPG